MDTQPIVNISRPATIQEAMGSRIAQIDLALAEAWIDALESGEYAQTTHALHDQNGYCCLGVLCDVAARSDVIAGEWRPATTSGIMSFHYMRKNDGFDFAETRTLPDILARKLGLQPAGGIKRDMIHYGLPIPFTIRRKDGTAFDYVYLASANDSGDVDFVAIARALRQWFGLTK